MPQESPGQKSQYPFPEATLVSEGEEEYVFRVNATAFVNLDPFEEWVVYASSDCRGEELAHYQVARWISNQTTQVQRTCANVFPLSGLHKTYLKVSIREEGTYPPRVFHKTPASSKECVWQSLPYQGQTNPSTESKATLSLARANLPDHDVLFAGARGLGHCLAYLHHPKPRWPAMPWFQDLLSQQRVRRG